MSEKKPYKSELGEWHHRVPDFKLVYCGPKRPTKAKKSETELKQQ